MACTVLAVPASCYTAAAEPIRGVVHGSPPRPSPPASAATRVRLTGAVGRPAGGSPTPVGAAWAAVCWCRLTRAWAGPRMPLGRLPGRPPPPSPRAVAAEIITAESGREGDLFFFLISSMSGSRIGAPTTGPPEAMASASSASTLRLANVIELSHLRRRSMTSRALPSVPWRTCRRVCMCTYACAHLLTGWLTD